MIGEISCAINRVEEQIEQLFDEKEEFIMANEDVCHAYGHDLQRFEKWFLQFIRKLSQ